MCKICAGRYKKRIYMYIDTHSSKDLEVYLKSEHDLKVNIQIR